MPRPSVRDLKDDDLAAWSIVVLEFVKGRDLGNPAWDQWIEIVQGTAQKRNYKGLRMVARDISDLASGLSERDREALAQIVEQNFGPDSVVFKPRRGR